MECPRYPPIAPCHPSRWNCFDGSRVTRPETLPFPPSHTFRWYCFDDDRVGLVDAGKVCSSAAYVLFYRRRHEAMAEPSDLLEQLMQARAQQVRPCQA